MCEGPGGRRRTHDWLSPATVCRHTRPIGNLAALIETHDGDAIALVDGGETVTYGQLRGRVDALRSELLAADVGSGDTVVLACGNEIHFVVGALATLGIGAAAAPLNPYSPPAEFRRKAEPLAPSAVLVGDVANWLLSDEEGAGAPLIDMAGLPAVALDAPAILDVDDRHPAFLMSTSGVSGSPKVAELSHGALRWVQEALIGDGPQDLRSDDVALAALPLAHVLGLNQVVFATLRVGGTVVLQRRFDVDESIALIRDHGVTMLTGAPPMWKRWAEAEAPRDTFANIRFARSGAASLPQRTAQLMWDRYRLQVVEGYGLTETSSVVTTERNHPARSTSVGKPLPGVELVIVDDDGEPVASGDVGEIVVRTPGVFSGYTDDAEATAQVLTSDGWLWTGDVGLVDDDGYLYLVDRMKDVIIVSGFNVYPAEVEEVLAGHPGVEAAVVVGAPHGATGEAVIAHVTGSASEEELDAFVRAHLSRYKCPTKYRFVDDLPATPAGKTIRRELQS